MAGFLDELLRDRRTGALATATAEDEPPGFLDELLAERRPKSLVRRAAEAVGSALSEAAQLSEPILSEAARLTAPIPGFSLAAPPPDVEAVARAGKPVPPASPDTGLPSTPSQAEIRRTPPGTGPLTPEPVTALAGPPVPGAVRVRRPLAEVLPERVALPGLATVERIQAQPAVMAKRAALEAAVQEAPLVRPAEARREGGVMAPRRGIVESIIESDPFTAFRVGASRSIAGLLGSAVAGGQPAFGTHGVEQRYDPTLLDQAVETLASLAGPDAILAFGVFSLPGRFAGGQLATALVKRFGQEATAKAAARVAANYGGAITALEGFEGATNALQQAGQAGRGERPSVSGGEVAAAAGRGALVGTALGFAGLAPGRLLKVGAELGVLASVPPVLEGREPTLQDVLDAGVLVGTLRATGALSQGARRALATPRAQRTLAEQAEVDAIPAPTGDALARQAVDQITARARESVGQLETDMAALEQRGRNLFGESLLERARQREREPEVAEAEAQERLRARRPARPPLQAPLPPDFVEAVRTEVERQVGAALQAQPALRAELEAPPARGRVVEPFAAKSERLRKIEEREAADSARRTELAPTVPRRIIQGPEPDRRMELELRPRPEPEARPEISPVEAAVPPRVTPEARVTPMVAPTEVPPAPEPAPISAAPAEVGPPVVPRETVPTPPPGPPPIEVGARVRLRDGAEATVETLRGPVARVRLADRSQRVVALRSLTPIAAPEALPPAPRQRVEPVDLASFSLDDPEGWARLIRSRGKLRPSEALQGEMRQDIPWWLVAKKGQGTSSDELADEVARARDADPIDTERRMIQALGRLRTAKAERQVLEGTEAGPDRPPADLADVVDVDDWQLMSLRQRMATVQFLRGEVEAQDVPPGIREPLAKYEAGVVREQPELPGTPRRRVPPTPIRPEGEQRPLEELPLFGQERARRDAELGRAQLEIASTDLDRQVRDALGEHGLPSNAAALNRLRDRYGSEIVDDALDRVAEFQPPPNPPLGVGRYVARPPARLLAPAMFDGMQERRGRPPMPLYTLTEDLPGHPKGSTLSGETLEQLGYRLPPGETAEPPVAREPTAPFAAQTRPESAPAPMFFSALQRAVEARMPVRAVPQQVASIAKTAPGVKPDEIKWSGLDDFLRERQGRPVTKDEVRRFLQENEVRVEEVVAGSAKQRELEDAERNFREVARVHRRGFPERYLGTTGLTDVGLDVTSGNLPLESLPTPLREPGQRLLDAYRVRNEAKERQTKFERFTLPGGENYGELLLVWQNPPGATKEPGRAGGPTPELFRSPHWDEPNVLAHVRFNERTDSERKRVLFIEELQSDWFQQARRVGFRPRRFTELPLGYRVVTERSELVGRNLYYVVDQNAARFTEGFDSAREAVGDALDALNEGVRGAAPGVAEAPFAKTWHELALKRMLREAAERGFDKIGWTTGEQQAERYDLSKHVIELRYEPPQGDRTHYILTAVSKPTGDLINLGAHEAAELDRVVGKDAAEKMRRGEGRALMQSPEAEDIRRELQHRGYTVRSDGNLYRGQRLIEFPGDAHPPEDGKLVRRYFDLLEGGGPGVKVLSGLDLKIGGEGMRAFYDQIVPNFLRQYGKKWGARVGETRLVPTFTDEASRQEFARALEQARAAGNMEFQRAQSPVVPALDIPPAMRQSVLTEGQALFEKGRRYANREDANENTRQLTLDLLGDLDRVAQALPDPDRAVGRPADVPAIQTRAGVKTIALGITHDLVRTGRVDLVGRPARTARQVAELAQVLRDPRFETLRLFYVDDAGAILAHEAVSSRLPSTAVPFVTKGLRGPNYPRGFFEVRDRMRRLGATGYWMEHNHPSGKSRPSLEDVALTREFQDRVPGLKGHVVIDDGEFSVIAPGVPAERGRPGSLLVQTQQIDPGESRRLLEASIPHDALGRTLSNGQDSARLAQTLHARQGWVPLVFLDAQNRVRAIQEMPEALFSKTTEATNYLRGARRAFGTPRFVAVLPGTPSGELRRAADRLDFLDIIAEGYSVGPQTRRRVAEPPLRGFRVGEPGPEPEFERQAKGQRRTFTPEGARRFSEELRGQGFEVEIRAAPGAPALRTVFARRSVPPRPPEQAIPPAAQIPEPVAVRREPSSRPDLGEPQAGPPPPPTGRGTELPPEGPPPLEEPILQLGRHKQVVDAAEVLFREAGIPRDPARWPILSDQLLDLLREGRLELPTMQRALEARDLSLADFGELLFRPAIKNAAQRLQILSALQRSLNEMARQAATKDEARALVSLAEEAGVLGRESDDGRLLSWWRRADNIRRGLLVTQLATAVRNFETQVGRLGVDVLDRAVQRVFGGRQADPWAAWEAFADASSQVRPTPAGGAARQIAQSKIDALLERFPKDWNRLFGSYSSDIARQAREQNVPLRGMDRAFAGAERMINLLNFFNRFQEFAVRRAVFWADLSSRVARRGLDADAIARGDRRLSEEEWGRIEPDVKAAVQAALEITFAQNPAYGTAGWYFTKLVNKLPLVLSGPIPFPRFMVNSLKFLYDFSPLPILTGQLFTAAERARWAAGDRQTISRATIGTGLLVAAWLAREAQPDGNRWYEVDAPGLGTVDLRPFNPFAAYFFLGELAKRTRAGTRYKIDAQDLIRGIASANVRGGLGLFALDKMVQGLGELSKTGKLGEALQSAGGELLSGLLVPLRTLTDLYAEFDPNLQIVRERRAEPLLGPAQAQFGIGEPVYLPTRAAPQRREAPLLRQTTGLTLVSDKNPLEQELDRFQFDRREIQGPSTGDPVADNLIAKHMGPLAEARLVPFVQSAEYRILSDAARMNALRLRLESIRGAAKTQAMREDFERFRALEEARRPARERLLRQERGLVPAGR